MKKFYLGVALLVCSFLLCSISTYAQPPYTPAETFETTLIGGDVSNPATWVGTPPDLTAGCGHCQIILHGTVNIDVHVFLDAGSLVTISPGTTVNVNSYVIAGNNTEIDVLNNSTLVVNDEFDLYNGANVQLQGNNSIVDATNSGGHVPQGPLGPASNNAGIYYIKTGAFPALGSYDFILNLFGYGDPQAGPGSGLFFDMYTINCAPFPPPPGTNLCSPAIVYGPAGSKLNPDPTAPYYAFFFGSPLPVTLVQLIASRNDDGTDKVSWATSQEENASHFAIERSGDAGSWTTIGTVNAKGFSSITTNYSYTDLFPLTGYNYYRLKMVDLDGKFKYSKIVSVSSDTKGESLVVYNNPFTDLIRLKINTNNPGNLTLTVTDMLGKTYLNQSIKATSGDNFVNINPGGAAGLYILHIQGKGYDKIVKLVKE